MHPSRRLLGLALALAVVAAAPASAHAQVSSASPARKPYIEAEAGQLLRRASAFYQQLPRWQSELVLLQRIGYRAGSNEMMTSMSLAHERPAKLKLVRRGELAGVWAANGSTVTLFLLRENQYLRAPQPLPLDEALAEPTLGAMLVTNGMAPFLRPLVTFDPYSAFTSEAEVVKLGPNRPVGEHPCRMIILQKNDMAVLLYIDAGTEPWLRRIEVDLSEALERARQYGERVPTELLTQLTFINLQTRVPPSEFAYRPPLDAKPFPPHPQGQATPGARSE